MKRSFLILSTALLLVGCTSEPTELERCIEANFESLLYSPVTATKQEQALETLRTDQIKINCTADGASSFGRLEGESTEQCIERRLRSHYESLYRMSKINAKKICNAQGIY